MPAGFYYKTFLWPRWETFEPSIRAMAGLGRIDPDNRPPADNPQFNAHCDLLVIGAGPAGLAAASAAARRGAVVFLVDDHPEIGGQLLHRGGAIDGGDWREWAEPRAPTCSRAAGACMTATTAFGVYDHNLVLAWERRAGAPDALWKIRPKRMLVAAGAIERPLVLPDNDRPGVMSADAALVYLRRYARARRRAHRHRDQQRQRLPGRGSAERSGRGGRDFRPARRNAGDARDELRAPRSRASSDATASRV